MSMSFKTKKDLKKRERDKLEKLRILTIKYNLYSGLIFVHKRGKQLISNKSYKMINNGKNNVNFCPTLLLWCSEKHWPQTV